MIPITPIPEQTSEPTEAAALDPISVIIGEELPANKFAESTATSERVFYLVVARELKSSEQGQCGYMRSGIKKYEGPKDYIKGLSR